MDQSRRRFLKWAGGAVVLAAGAKTATEALATGGEGHGGADPRDRGKEGKRWAMVVDLKKAEQQASVLQEACHRVHNVPNIPVKKQEIKWVWTADKFHNAFPDQAHAHLPHAVEEAAPLVLCNHCDNPPCVRACPTQATFRRRDGIVTMDFHRCIGCRLCALACPYGARNLNFRDPRPYIDKIDKNFPTRTRGVVEKCNFCAERIGRGQQPACVEAATDDALVFGDLNDPGSKIAAVLSENFTIRRKPGLGTQPMVFYIV